nr:unnamed protein product [Digitaria exilis]
MDIEYHEEHVRNPRGVQLFTCRWLPASSSPKALVFLCHECGIKMATAGYGVFGIDYEGHGKSMGIRCYIQKFDNLGYRNRSRFLYGESMGGAVALLLHRKDPAFWDGAVLVAPMCKIRKNKLIYQDKPRLKSALELLRTSRDVEDNLQEVRMPFLVLHGEDDKVTDPEVSRALYQRSASTDKTIKLYQGMWHGLTAGEPDENVELVFSDILVWLDQRSRHWKPEERVRTPLEPENKQQLSKKIIHATSSNGAESPVVPVSSHGRSKRGCSFLCGLVDT